MPPILTVGRDAVAGFVSGVVILGLGGRLLMRFVASGIHGSGGFSFGGSLEVLKAPIITPAPIHESRPKSTAARSDASSVVYFG